MHMKLIKIALTLLVGLAVLTPPGQARAELTCGALPEFVRLFLRSHVLYNQIDDEIEQRAIENYVLSMDRSRTLLTEPEAQALRESLVGVFAQISGGQCIRIADVHKVFVRRHEAAAKFVRQYVKQDDSAVDESTSLVLDPEQRGYTAWCPFKQDAAKYEPSKLPFMVNYRVADLVGLLAELRTAGVEIVGDLEQHENGKFAWIMDPEGRKIELWEPVPSAEDPYLI